jgi:hypothetical protein
MTRLIAAIAFAAFPLACAANGFALAPIFAPAGVTDLSRPGALERLHSDRPEHFLAVQEIAKAGSRLTCGQQDLADLKVSFPVDRLDCGFLIMTSNPPQRRINFAIEGQKYAMTVFVRDTAPRLIGSRAF